MHHWEQGRQLAKAGPDGEVVCACVWCRYFVLCELNAKSDPVQRHVTPLSSSTSRHALLVQLY